METGRDSMLFLAPSLTPDSRFPRFTRLLLPSELLFKMLHSAELWPPKEGAGRGERTVSHSLIELKLLPKRRPNKLWSIWVLQWSSRSVLPPPSHLKEPVDAGGDCISPPFACWISVSNVFCFGPAEMWTLSVTWQKMKRNLNIYIEVPALQKWTTGAASAADLGGRAVITDGEALKRKVSSLWLPLSRTLLQPF